MLCGSPIGNAADASQRLRETLETADVIAAEDTRRLRRLASDLGIRVAGEVLSYYEANERGRVPQLVERMLGGSTVAADHRRGNAGDLRSGLPAGARGGRGGGRRSGRCPGPSAVTTALAMSGLALRSVGLRGLPAARRWRAPRPGSLSSASERRTIVLLESPRRIERTLGELAEAFGADRDAVLCRELTKTYEEVLRLPLGELAAWAAEREVRGEITLVVAGAPDPAAARLPAISPPLSQPAEAAGLDRKAAMAEVARAAGVPRREVYDAVLAAGSGCGQVRLAAVLRPHSRRAHLTHPSPARSRHLLRDAR